MDEEKHVITDREKRAYQAGKDRKRSVPDPLDRKKEKAFLRLMAEGQGTAIFEMRMGFSAQDVEYHKHQLGVDSPFEARDLLAKLAVEHQVEQEKRLEKERAKAKNAHAAAERRLDELERSKERRGSVARDMKMTPQEIAKEHQERQKRLEKSQARPTINENEWCIEGDQIKKFHNDILDRGLMFCVDKYSVSVARIKSEAEKLQLRVDWDLVRR
jgi:hypothetical protein